MCEGRFYLPLAPTSPNIMLFFSCADCYSAIFMASLYSAPIKGSLLSARKCDIAKKRKCPPLVSCVSSKQENEQTLLKIFFLSGLNQAISSGRKEVLGPAYFYRGHKLFAFTFLSTGILVQNKVII